MEEESGMWAEISKDDVSIVIQGRLLNCSFTAKNFGQLPSSEKSDFPASEAMNSEPFNTHCYPEEGAPLCEQNVSP